MNVTLSPDLESFINAKIQQGEFASPDAFLTVDKTFQIRRQGPSRGRHATRHLLEPVADPIASLVERLLEGFGIVAGPLSELRLAAAAAAE